MNTKTENAYTELMAKFKVDCASILEEAHADLYGEMLPFVDGDTESNAGHRAREIVRRIIIGDFELKDSCIYVDGYSIGHINAFGYNKLVDTLAEVAGDAAKDAKIKRLENEIDHLLSIR